MNKYSKGAEWRVWDLQIQTILDDRYESLNTYYLALKAEDPVKWNSYVALVGGEENALLFDTKEYFGDHSKTKKERCNNYVRNTFAFLEIYKPYLGVIGITDHNYDDDTLIDEFFKYSKSTKCQVVCGVEINVGGIHILVFFDKPPYEKSTFSEGIKTFLSKIDVDHPKTNGVLTLSPKSCQDVMKEVKNSEGIFMFPHCNSSNGLFQERTKSDRTHLSDIFNHFPSIILQSNSRDSIEKVAGYIQTNPTLFKSKAIYTTASDARSLRDFGNADSDGHYLWIKGDPNFEGLKQIHFEPSTRVRIDKDFPETKQSYLVIDKVRFITAEGDLNFPEHPIEINDKLNGVIGGKSSGKSIILYYIAKTIDPTQVDRKIKDSSIDISYDFEREPNFDFEVTWADGEIYTLKNNAVTKSRQITYVPQMFINYLAEKGGQNELRKLIQEILEQKPLFKVLYDAQIQIINEHKIKLTSGLESYYQIIDQLETNETDLKAKGDKKAREDNVKQKNMEIDDLRKKSGFSEQQELEYQTLKDLQNIYLKRFTNLSSLKYAYENDYLPHLKSTKLAIQPSLTNIHNNVVGKNLITAFISNYLSKDIKSDNEKINKTFDDLILKAEKRIEKIETLLELNEDRLTVFRDLLAPYVAKIQNQEKLEELNQTIVNEQLILNGIYELETVKANLVIQKDSIKTNFLDAYKVIYEAYLAIADTVNSNPLFSEISSEKGIILSSKIEFDTQLFSDTTISLINSQGYLSSKIGNYIDSDNNLIFDPSRHLENIGDFFDRIQDYEEHNIRFNRGGDPRTVSKKLFQNLFVIKYELSQNKESILKMSPGKKGMILLFLILHLSNAEYPILIDQPEDNLDNRTVYKELKEFIKEKKIQRQIIIVTHNANLIVPTDSENIIIANQNGQDNSKDNEKYRFEYITGSLENSFVNSGGIGILNKMGVKEHVCDILEGGTEAFKEREQKYDLA